MTCGWIVCVCVCVLGEGFFSNLYIALCRCISLTLA
jgi:hypothetical protein